MKCEKCGLDLDLPFRCNYCRNYYCPEHRLPENHDCPETWRVKAVRSARLAMPPQATQETRSVLMPARSGKLIRFGSTEKKHLIVGTALVSAAGISFFLNGFFSYEGLAVATGLFAMGFILHELAHKYVAQGYGLWAEFRLNMTGVLLTALSVLSPFIKFIAPGAVMIGGFVDRDKMGRTAIAGPIVNVIMTAGLLAIIPVINNTWLYQAILAGAAINAFLALFNLIPLAMFDGRKVYAWNRKFWAALFIISLALTIYTNFVLHSY